MVNLDFPMITKRGTGIDAIKMKMINTDRKINNKLIMKNIVIEYALSACYKHTHKTKKQIIIIPSLLSLMNF